jgi:hypothetical protein
MKESVNTTHYTSQFNMLFDSGCPEAIKIIVGNKADLDSEVDITQVRVSYGVISVELIVMIRPFLFFMSSVMQSSTI